MVKTVSVAKAKNQFSVLLNRVSSRHERVIVSKHGKPVGAIVSTEDLKRLEEIENQSRLKRVRALVKSTKKYVPFERFVREYEEKWGVDLGLKLPEKSSVRD